VVSTNGSHQWLFNIPDDSCCVGSSYNWTFDDAWHCAEWNIDVATESFRFFSDGKEVTLAGQTNIRAGTEIKVTTERPSMALRLSELDSGSWVIFDLPGFTTAASGTREDSLDALRKASATSYYKDKDSLWVKVVSNGEGARISGPGAGDTSIDVSR